MNILSILLLILQGLLLIYFALASLYILLFSVASLFTKKNTPEKNLKQRKFAVLIPGYKEDNVIVEVAARALEQNYPSGYFDVVIIADSFLPETLKNLRSMPVKLIEVSFEVSTKSKALNKAMEQLPEDYDFALVLDADNIMESDFLIKINKVFSDNFMALQAHRTAKNTNTALATLDAISEEINNNIFRKGHQNMGLSSAIIGSGMAFPYHFFKEMMKNIKAVGGFDKEIELTLLKNRQKIAYLEDALLYDEKVSQSDNFSNQRRRWLSAQLFYFRKFFPDSLKDLLLKGNLDYFDKAFQMILPPRIFQIGLLPLLLIIFGIINSFNGNGLLTLLWFITTAAAWLAVILAVPKKFLDKKTLFAVLSLPKGIWMMLLSLLKLKGANKKFIHTTHGTH